MKENKVQLSSIVENQLPEFIRSEFPLVNEFLSQYYWSLEHQGGSYDLINNLDEYVKVDNIAELVDSTVLTTEIDRFSKIIRVDSIQNFPSRYGLFSIDDEIITYTSTNTNEITGTCVIEIGSNIAKVSGIDSSLYLGRPFIVTPFKTTPTIVAVEEDHVVLSEVLIYDDQQEGYTETDTYKFAIDHPQFEGCVRGFSGITSYEDKLIKDQLVFSTSNSSNHLTNSNVTNLSILFLKKFLIKIKAQITPGLENRELYSEVNEKLFIKQSVNF